jgi:DnaJ domain
MSSSSNVDPLLKAMEKFKPNETKKSSVSRKDQSSVIQHGLPSPEATPEVEEGRLRADTKRRQQEESSLAPKKSNSFSVTKPSHPSASEESDVEAEGDLDGSISDGVQSSGLNEARKARDKQVTAANQGGRSQSGAEEEEKKGKGKAESEVDWTEEQEQAVERVLSAHFNFQILGLKPGHHREETVKKRWRELALTLHPDKNRHPQAGEAFKSKYNSLLVTSRPWLMFSIQKRRPLQKSLEWMLKLERNSLIAMATQWISIMEMSLKESQYPSKATKARKWPLEQLLVIERGEVTVPRRALVPR